MLREEEPNLGGARVWVHCLPDPGDFSPSALHALMAGSILLVEASRRIIISYGL